MIRCRWSWRSSKWDLSKSWAEFQSCIEIIKTCLKMVLGLITCHQSVSGALIISPLGRTWKQNSVSHCNVAQVKHHEQVVVGGHLAALASSGEVNFIQTFSEINNAGPISEIHCENAKYFDFLLIIFLKILFQIWNLWGNLRATSRGPSTVSAIFLQPWQVSLNGLGTPYIGYVAKTDSNLKT